ncbi:hypothetical protein [Pelagicoccus mobilis]|uniref:Uncharacterized protein n=1 Tax=Pelagicoccus mobilis TaxID=415221 RepID=A0A934VTS6_9BACT|nr:hypothetical protein [Pelagicoccus mobilis]MBK1880385.1 hypothetical protein [Pelagicoccus mobilis]
MQAEFFTESPDGYLEERAVLQCEEFDLIFSVTKRWQAADEFSDRFSFVFESLRHEGVYLGVAEFELSEFLPDLSQEVWDAYVRGLKKAEPKVEITFSHFSLERSEPPIILNSVYRQIDYVERLALGDSRKTREIFALIRDRLVVFSFWGDEEILDQNRRAHNLLLTRMDLLEHN